jgi:hypothetical protein
MGLGAGVYGCGVINGKRGLCRGGTGTCEINYGYGIRCGCGGGWRWHGKLPVHRIGLSSILKSKVFSDMLRSGWYKYLHIHTLHTLSTSQNRPDLRQMQPVKSDSYHHGY